MEIAFIYVIVLLHAAFAGVFFFLNWQYPNRFSRLFAWCWTIEALRAAVNLPAVHNLGGWSSPWFGLADALCCVANWCLLAGFADLAGVRLPRRLSTVYVGASVPLVILSRFVLAGLLHAQMTWPVERADFFCGFLNMVVLFVPVTAARLVILVWLFGLWRRTRMPGALIAMVFAMPYAVVAALVPIQYWFSFHSDWLAFLWCGRVLGFSVGLVILMLNRQHAAVQESAAGMAAAEALARLGSWQFDPVTGAGTWSEEMFRLCGRDPSGRAPDHRGFLAMIHPEDQAALLAAEHSARESGAPGEAHLRTNPASGPIRYLHVMVRAVREESGRPRLAGTVQDETERKLAGSAMVESEARYRFLFESNPAPMMIYDRGTLQMLAVNEALLRHYGYSREEALGLRLTDLYPDEEKSRISALVPRLHGYANVGEWHHRRRDGSIMTIVVTSHDLDYEGRPARVAVITDITERQRAEAELRRRTAEVTALNSLGREVSSSLSLEIVAASALQTILGTVNTDLAFLFMREGERLVLAGIAPDSGRQRLGQIPEHRVGECMCGLAVRLGQPLYSRDIFTDARCTWDECKKAGFRSFAALPLRRSEAIIGVLGLASLTARDFAQQAEFLEAIAGTVSASLQNAHLFEETRRTEAALRESEKRYRQLFDLESDAIVVVDNTTGQILEVNAAATRLYGYSREEWLRLKNTDVSVEPEETRLAMVDRPSLIPIRRHRKKNGEVFPLEMTVSFFEMHGREVHMVAIRDITERLQAENERRKLEVQMQQTQKLESLGLLAGGIAHDFNNLLTAIVGHANLARMDLAPQLPAVDSLREIEEASRRAAELCRQMLAYAGHGRFVTEVVDLSRLVRELVHLLQVSLSKKVRLSCQLAEDLPTIEGDAAQLRQVIMNLVINAAEAVGDTEGVIVVATGARQCDDEFLRGAGSIASLVPPPPGRYVCLEITDTGCGMDAETLARIFDPFFTTKFAGRGLGLAAVLGIVRQHKGMLKVQSERGKGTAFRVLFPASGKAIPPAAPDAAPPSWRGTGTVLLVDDEEPVRRVATKMLERCGFRVLTAGDGREAVDRFRQHSDEIVCVLLDLAMPCMNGEETFRELRRLQPGVRIILASGYSDSEVLGRFNDGGLAASIEKPYELPALNALLQKVLTQPGPTSPPIS